LDRRNDAAHRAMPSSADLERASLIAVAVAGEVNPSATRVVLLRCRCGQLNRAPRLLAGESRRCGTCYADDNTWARTDGGDLRETSHGPRIEQLVGQLYLHWRVIEQMAPRGLHGRPAEGSELVDLVAMSTGLGDAVGFSRRTRRRCGHQALPPADEIERATQIAAEIVATMRAA
jgi:hypothetical protein